MNDILPVLPSPPDDRDYQRSWWERTVASINLPEQKELVVPKVWNQAQHGSCLAHGLGASMAIQLLARGIVFDPSMMSLYWWIRALSLRHHQDVGGTARDMCKAGQRFGGCRNETYPYIEENLYRVPTEEAIIEAIRGISDIEWMYERIPEPGPYDGVPQYTACNTAIKSYLAQGIPVLATIEVDTDFTPSCTGKAWREQDWHKTYKPGIVPRGLHEVLIVGYDDRPTTKRYKVLNSWGDQWGDQGYFGLMYQPLKSQVWQARVIKELWVVKPK